MNEVIECRATRRGRKWVAHEPEHGVYGAGRTLRLVRRSIEAGLASISVTAEVKIIPVTPELEKLRSIDDARETALREAVAALALRRTSVPDIAQATGETVAQVKRLLAERTKEPAPVTERTACHEG
ncbi:hypothetical protein [Streptomyces sp. NPDC007083]|uniref:hypothetical protein n=1 Tax=Streptomyces sp. NPDC007083 TaxID=3156913 RepID=UPI0033EC875B